MFYIVISFLNRKDSKQLKEIPCILFSEGEIKLRVFYFHLLRILFIETLLILQYFPAVIVYQNKVMKDFSKFMCFALVTSLLYCFS